LDETGHLGFRIMIGFLFDDFTSHGTGAGIPSRMTTKHRCEFSRVNPTVPEAFHASHLCQGMVAGFLLTAPVFVRTEPV